MKTSYDVHDWAEKVFDVYKNDLDRKRNRTDNVERAKGRFFIKYIALMIRFMFRMFRENTIGTSHFIQ